MADTHRLGEKVRSIRESRSMTGEQLAERADLAPELVAQIESGALIPSLSPLIRIARALGVRLGTFLDDEEHVGPVVSRVGGARAGVSASPDASSPSRSDLDFFSLAANKAGRHMEPFLIDIHPLSAQAAASFHARGRGVHLRALRRDRDHLRQGHVPPEDGGLHLLRQHRAAPRAQRRGPEARVVAVYAPS